MNISKEKPLPEKNEDGSKNNNRKILFKIM